MRATLYIVTTGVAAVPMYRAFWCQGGRLWALPVAYFANVVLTVQPAWCTLTMHSQHQGRIMPSNQ
jgi:hypothetical protein